MSQKFEDLRTDEVELVGQWISSSNQVVADAVDHRIGWLIGERLKRLAPSADGWEVLYHDPRDGRLWELNYPQSHWHGGGPRCLHVVTPEQARAKYAVQAV